MFYRSPTYNLDTEEWSHTEYATRKDVVLYLRSKVKYPSKYDTKYADGVWNKQGKLFQENKTYPKYLNKSLDFRRHWDVEKERCKWDGFITYIKPSEGVAFAVPCLYYWYLNYCPIPDKMVAKLNFAEIWDSDLHYFLYILRCIIERKFACIIKARQKGYTLKNMAIMLNCIWFGEAAVAKIFAQDESKVKDAWGFIELYRDHINNYCGWKRGFDPGKKLDWQVRRKRVDGSYYGNMSIAKGFTTKQDPSSGIGGSASFLYGEESGANSTLGTTHEFVTSNVAIGGLTTGLIVYSGSVGELDKAEDLKEFILFPEENGFLSCDNDIEDDVEFGPKVGFFAPEWWNYISVEEDEDGNQFGEVLKCYDKDGNTNKPLAMLEIAKHRKKAESKKKEAFRYYKSQRPLSIREAFAFRKDSVFPMNLIEAQERRIEAREYSVEHLDIEKDDTGALKFVKSHRLPIKDFPITKSDADKEGIIEVWERPFKELPELAKFYYASIDPVGTGKTVTSDSLVSIYIYKLDVEVTKQGQDFETYVECGKIVASWCGRFDDINKTHQRLQYMVQIYGAWALVENNISAFITHMINKKLQHYLVPKNQIMFLKDLESNEQVFSAYGWRNTGSLFKLHLLTQGIEFLKEEIDHKIDANGINHRTTFGVERIPDAMLFKEMKAYPYAKNYDRLVAYCALVAFIKVQQANRGYAKRLELDESAKKANKSLYVKEASFFKSNRPAIDSKYKINKSPFKHLK